MVRKAYVMSLIDNLGANHSCPSNVSLGNGSPASGSLEMMGTVPGPGVNDISGYDTFIKGATPVMLVGWLKNITNSS